MIEEPRLRFGFCLCIGIPNSGLSGSFKSKSWPNASALLKSSLFLPFTSRSTGHKHAWSVPLNPLSRPAFRTRAE
jgi:hypothetical protein